MELKRALTLLALAALALSAMLVILPAEAGQPLTAPRAPSGTLPRPAGGLVPCSPAELPLRHVNLTARLERRAYINYTLLVIEDQLTIRAEGEAELSSFLYGVPLTWAEGKRARLLFFSVDSDDFKGEIEASEELQLGDLDLKGYLLSLEPPLAFSEGDEVSLNLTLVLNGTLSISRKGEAREYEHELDVPLYPCTSLRLSNASITIELPAGATAVRMEPSELESDREKVGEVWLIYHNATDVEEFTSRTVSVKFNKGEPLPLFYCPEAVREVRLGPLGTLSIMDTYELRSDVRGKVEYVDILLPSDASSISALDLMGRLKTRVEEVGGVKRVRITFRSPVEPVAGRFTLKLYYELPWHSYVRSLGALNYELEFNVTYGLNWPVEHLSVKILLPEGARLTYSEPGPDYVSRSLVLREEVGFSFTSILPLDGPRVSLRFSYPAFWPSLWPTMWACLAGLVGCLMIKLLKVPPIALPALAVPAEKIVGFVEAYERRMRLREELSSLRTALRQKKISRRKYKARSRAINEELARLDKKIASLRSELAKAGGMVAELLRNIEVAESELASVERDTRTLEARYLRKEVSSEAYRRLMREYRKREDRARVAIREALLRLRELVS